MTSKRLEPTGERILPSGVRTREEHLIYLRHVFAYEIAAGMLADLEPVLEVGCGEGYGTALLAERVGRVVGSDVNASAVAHASRAYGSRQCRFVLYDGRRLPFPEGSFAGAVAFQVIEHVGDERAFLVEILRVLREGGMFLLTTPNRLYRLRPGQRPWNRFHVREYAPEELAEALREHFWEVRVHGIRGDEEVQRTEIERVRRIRRVDALDPLGLRRLVPEALQPALIRLAKRIGGGGAVRPQEGDFRERYGLDRFQLLRDNVGESLDLLGVCRKKRGRVRDVD